MQRKGDFEGRLTEVSVKKDAYASTSHPKRGEKPPDFGHGELEYPWQVEDDSASTDEIAVYKQGRSERQGCQSPYPISIRAAAPWLEKGRRGWSMCERYMTYLDTGGAAQYASIIISWGVSMD